MTKDQNKVFKTFTANARYSRADKDYFIEHDGKILTAPTPADLFDKYCEAKGVPKPERMPATTIAHGDNI